MSVAKMKMVNLEGEFSKLDEVSIKCLISECFQPEDSADSLSESLHGVEKIDGENPYRQAIDRIVGIMNLSGIQEPSTLVDAGEISIDKCNEELNAFEEEFGEIQTEREKLKTQASEAHETCDHLKHFTGIDIPLHDIFSCKFVKVRFGSIPAESYNMLEMYGDDPNIVFVPCSNNKKTYWGMYAAPATVIDEVDRVFAMLGFNWLILPDAITSTDEAISHYQEEENNALKRIEEINQEIKDYWKNKSSRLCELYSALKYLSSAFEIRKYAIRHKDIFVMVGWIPANKQNDFKKLFDGMENVKITFTDIDSVAHSNPPTLLKNSKLVNSYEFYVKMFGVPKYGEMDPTFFIAITYTLLYGIMFADVGQGIILSIVGYFMYKLKKMELGRLLIPCGISGAFFGLVFGSVFGFEEVLNPLYKAIGFKNGKPINVLDSSNTMTILIAAIAIGVILLVIAIMLGIYSKIRQKNIGEAIFSASGVVGLVLYCGIILFALNMLLGLGVPTAIIVVVLILAVILLWLSEPLAKLVNGEENWKPESWGGYLIQGFFEVFEGVLSYLTNTVSFLRVGAFVLVHASMMMVFFNLAEMFGGVGYWIMVIFGNVFVLVLEGLLVGVQSLRLEFYEMFSRFYEGSGTEFKPICVRNNK